MTVNTVV